VAQAAAVRLAAEELLWMEWTLLVL
jgi:hypothetical protein